MHQLEISISQSHTNTPLNRVNLNYKWNSINLGECKITNIFWLPDGSPLQVRIDPVEHLPTVVVIPTPARTAEFANLFVTLAIAGRKLATPILDTTESQDSSALGKIQTSRARVTTTLKRTSSTTSRSQLTESPQAPPSTQTASGHSSNLKIRVKQLEEEITKARDSRETIASLYRSQFAFLYDKIRAMESGGTDTILWKLTSLEIVFDTAKSSRMYIAAKDPSTHYKSPVYRKHPYGYNFFVQFYPYGLDSAAGYDASIMFALFLGD